MTEFNKYLKEARQEFCKEVKKYTVSDNLQLRTACDSFLIAFDQATEKAINYTHCCKSDSEQLKVLGEHIAEQFDHKAEDVIEQLEWKFKNL